MRGWHVEGLAVRPEHRMIGHTGFLLTARRLAHGRRAAACAGADRPRRAEASRRPLAASSPMRACRPDRRPGRPDRPSRIRRRGPPTIDAVGDARHVDALAGAVLGRVDDVEDAGRPGPAPGHRGGQQLAVVVLDVGQPVDVELEDLAGELDAEPVAGAQVLVDPDLEVAVLRSRG